MDKKKSKLEFIDSKYKNLNSCIVLTHIFDPSLIQAICELTDSLFEQLE